MQEKFPKEFQKSKELYEYEEGNLRVRNSETAEEMARIEQKYRRKQFGVIPPSKERIAQGEEAAMREVIFKELPQSVVSIVRKYIAEHSSKEGGDKTLLTATYPGPGIFRLTDYKRFEYPNGEKVYQVFGHNEKYDREGRNTGSMGVIISVKLDQEGSVLETSITD